MITMNYLKVVFAPGVVPGKWFGRFDERMDRWRIASAPSDDPLAHVLSGAADIALVRFPGAWDGMPGSNVDDAAMERLGVHRVRLYEEQAGIAAPKEHVLSAVGDNEVVSMADIADEMVLYRGVEPQSVRENLDVVASNVGVVLAPRPLLRGVNRRGVIHRGLSSTEGTENAESTGDSRASAVGLVWLKDRDDDVIQQFVGVCRGRRASSTR